MPGRKTLVAVLAMLCSALGTSRMVGGEEFAPPQLLKLTTGGTLDVQRFGHAAPFCGDLNGDGLSDLLVGEFFQGRVKIFHNHGTKGSPQFGDYRLLRAGNELARVPTG